MDLAPNHDSSAFQQPPSTGEWVVLFRANRVKLGDTSLKCLTFSRREIHLGSVFPSDNFTNSTGYGDPPHFKESRRPIAHARSCPLMLFEQRIWMGPIWIVLVSMWAFSASPWHHVPREVDVNHVLLELLGYLIITSHPAVIGLIYCQTSSPDTRAPPTDQPGTNLGCLPGQKQLYTSSPSRCFCWIAALY
jgi:hypothetical protein